MKRIALLASLMATPAFAAGGDYAWYSLNDTNFVVLIAFTAFIGVLIYFGVPKLLTKLLDDRAEGIKSEIDEARALREEAQTILASFERKHKEVEGQVEGIIEHAKTEAQIAADAAKADLKDSIARRLQAALTRSLLPKKPPFVKSKTKRLTSRLLRLAKLLRPTCQPKTLAG